MSSVSVELVLIAFWRCIAVQGTPKQGGGARASPGGRGEGPYGESLHEDSLYIWRAGGRVDVAALLQGYRASRHPEPDRHGTVPESECPGRSTSYSLADR